jgi:hypothetical protein
LILTDYARETLGTPFKHQGRICGVGLDCVGVGVHIAKRAGLDYQDLPAYPRSPFRNLLTDTLNSQDCLQLTSELSEGCFLLMKFFKEPMHLAYCAGENIIHSYESVGRVVEHRLDSKWKSRIVKIYRIKI